MNIANAGLALSWAMQAILFIAPIIIAQRMPNGRSLLLFAATMAIVQIGAVFLLKDGNEAIPRAILWVTFLAGWITGTIARAVRLWMS